MLEIYTKRLMAGVQLEMDNYAHKHNQLKYFTHLALLYSKAIADLNAKIITYDFTSIEEEINFFKSIKPQLLAEQHYNFKRAMIIQDCQHVSKAKRDNYIMNKIARIDSFYVDNKEFSIYLTLDTNNRDKDYFVRLSSRKTTNLDYNLVDKDARTTCEKGHTIGKILSKQKLLVYLQSLLKEDQLFSMSVGLQVIGKLNWTGSKTEAIELIYALKTAGLIDEDISRIAEVLGHAFGFQTLDTYKTWQRIKDRKLEPTKLMSKLQKSLEEQIRAEIEA